MKRPLSRGQAARCESATTPRCKCRCGGAFHGANRITTDELERLPGTDPHKVVPPRQRRSAVVSAPVAPVQLAMEVASA